ncbi:MAG: PQQ-binding-like beta-propeller repeat protein [Candidatus Woesearchaeota archaeon]
MAIISKLDHQPSDLKSEWEFDAKSPIYSDITTGDINGDGKKEIICKSNNDEIFALSATGSRLWTYSFKTETELERLFLEKDSIKIICSNPVLADIDDDGKDEIIVGSSNGRMYAIKGDGTLIWSFKTNGAVHSTPAIEDINGDGRKEIIFGSSDKCLYALDSKGQRIWSFETGLEVESGVAVCDINNDGRKEIIFGSNDNRIYALNDEGDLLWQFPTQGPINATPRIGDIHNNGQLKIIVGSHDGFVYVIKANGNLEWKFKTNGKIVSEACVADINFDGKLEIVVTSCSYEENLLILSNMRDKIGSYGAGFWVTSSALVNDIDMDGNYEIVFGSYDHHVHILTFKRNPMDLYKGLLEQRVRLFDTSSIVVGTPAILENGLVIAATETGKILALRV